MSTTNWGNTRPALNGYNDSYLRPAMGTSFSAPLVAGTVGLMMTMQPTMSVSDIKSALMDSATPFPTRDPGGAITAPMCVSINDETYQGTCYCTTSTCGAGMLNAAAAVAKVAPPLVQITPSSTSARVGSNIVLNSAGSAARAGRSIVSYEWSILNPQGVVEFVGVTTGTVATIRLIRPSPFTVRLTVTDSAGYRSQEQVALSVLR
jgi:serine protease